MEPYLPNRLGDFLLTGYETMTWKNLSRNQARIKSSTAKSEKQAYPARSTQKRKGAANGNYEGETEEKSQFLSPRREKKLERPGPPTD